MNVVACRVCGRRNRVPDAGAGIPRCGNCGSPLPWITESGDADFAEVAEKSSIPVLVDLWAPWCGPCRTLSPSLERLARQRAGEVKLVKVNVDESPALAGRFAIQGIPTLVLMWGAREVARETGARPEYGLGAWLDEALRRANGDRAPDERSADTGRH